MQCPECSCTHIRKNGKKQGKHSSDATIEELRYLLYGRIGFFVSRSTIGRMIKLLDITVKKLFSLQAKAPSEFKSCDVSSEKQLNKLV